MFYYGLKIDLPVDLLMVLRTGLPGRIWIFFFFGGEKVDSPDEEVCFIQN